MVEESGFIQRVHEASRKKVLFSAHAVRQMAKAERMITTSDVHQVITENYIAYFDMRVIIFRILIGGLR